MQRTRSITLIKNWEGENIPFEKRVPTDAVQQTISVIKEIITGSDTRGQSEPRPPVICLMNSSGAGKTSTVIDAALACNCLHLRIGLSKFTKITDVAKKCASLFVHTEQPGFLARLDIINGFTKLYRVELALLFTACRIAIERQGFFSSTRSVEPVEAVPSPDDVLDPTERAWRMLIEAIPINKRVVAHIDDCDFIFGGGEYPQNGDLLRGDIRDRFSKVQAPRLAMRAFVDTLEQFITRTRKIAWVFTGLRHNLRVFLNVPTRLVCVDLSGSLTYFDASAVYRVLSRFARLPHEIPLDNIDERLEVKGVREFLERLVGPPRVIQCFLSAVKGMMIRDIKDLIARQEAVLMETSEILRSFIPGVKQPTDESLQKDANARGVHDSARLTKIANLRFCCIAPLLNAGGFPVDSTEKFYADLLADGVLHMSIQGTIRSGGHDGPRGSQGLEKRSYHLQPAYPLLQSILCTDSHTPTILIDLLLSLIKGPDNSQNRSGKTLEIALLAALTNPRTQSATDWLVSLGIGECLHESIRVAFRKEIDFDVEGDAVINSKDPSVHECGADLVFEADLAPVIQEDTKEEKETRQEKHSDSDGLCKSVCAEANSPAAKANTPATKEKVCVAVQVTYDATKSDAKIEKNVLGMARNAVDLYKAKKKRTIIVFASAVKELVAQLQVDIYSKLAQAHPSYIHFPHNTRLPEAHGLSVEGKTVSFRPYAIFFAGPESPIWKELVISVRNIQKDEKPAMEAAVLKQYAPDFFEKYTSHCYYQLDGSIHEPRGKISLLQEVVLADSDFVSLVRRVMGPNNPILDVIAQNQLTGLCFVVPEVLKYLPMPNGFTAETTRQLNDAADALSILKKDRIRPLAAVSLSDGGGDLIKSLLEWATPEREASTMEAFLRPLNSTAIETLTFEDMAACDVSLGTKLSVLAVISSVRANAHQESARPQKRKASEVGWDDIFLSVQNANLVNANILTKFQEHVNSIGILPGSLQKMEASDLVAAGFDRTVARSILEHVQEKFDLSS